MNIFLESYFSEEHAAPVVHYVQEAISSKGGNIFFWKNLNRNY